MVSWAGVHLVHDKDIHGHGNAMSGNVSADPGCCLMPTCARNKVLGTGLVLGARTRRLISCRIGQEQECIRCVVLCCCLEKEA
jgi:hypothetical protein